MLTLVTGATGLLGNNLVRTLLERGQPVRVLVREESDPRPLEGLEVEIARGDVRDSAAVQQAMADVDAVIHCAAYVHIGWSHLDLARAINVEGTRHVAEAARERGARMIHVSTVDTLAPGKKQAPADEETHGEKVPCTYVVTKREAEQVIQQQNDAGLDGVIVLPGFMLGPWDWKPSSGKMILETVRRFSKLAPRGGASVCDARDVASGALAAVERGQVGRKYILAGENLTYFDLWHRIARVAGGKGPWKRVMPHVPVLISWYATLRHKLTGREPLVNSALMRMSNLYHYYTSARAKSELGYATRPLDETLRDAWQWFVEHGYVTQEKSKRKGKAAPSD